MSEWKKHDGGRIPCGLWDIVEVMTRGFHKDARYGGNFQWESSGGPYDIIEYRIVEAPRESVRTVRYFPASMVLGFENKMQAIAGRHDFVEAITFEDGIPVSSTFERVK